MPTQVVRRHYLDSMAKEAVIDIEGTQRRSRVCLSCRGSFDSAWAGERICPRCKGGSAWRSGVVRTFSKP